MLIYSFSTLENEDDRQLLTELVDTYERFMYRVARSFTDSHADAEDVVSESFLKIIENFSKYKAVPRNGREGWIVVSLL